MMKKKAITFLSNLDEEYDFILGQAQVAKGLEVALVGMRMGERAILKMPASYGYSDTRRPKQVPANASLIFTVHLRRTEKEKNLHEMTIEDKLNFCDQRRDIGKELMKENKPLSAFRQYEKALQILEGIPGGNGRPGMNVGGLDQVEGTHKQERDQLILIHSVNSAVCKMKARQYADVITFCNKVLNIESDHRKALFLRGKAKLLRRDHEEAKTDLTRLTSLLEKDISNPKLKNNPKTKSISNSNSNSTSPSNSNLVSSPTSSKSKNKKKTKKRRKVKKLR